MTTVVIFPGQGSQRPGMGAGLFERYPQTTQLASELLGYSLADLCLADPDGLLGTTRYTQPARYLVNALSWLAARDEGLTADAFLGHSVGEYAALFAADVFDFATGLRLVTHRAAAMAAVPGGMSVVLGLGPDVIAAALRAAGLHGIDLANLNAEDQTVIAGQDPELAAADGPLRAAGARAVRRLDVSGPFHSRYMRAAARAYAEQLARYQLAAPRVPVIANRTAREYPGQGAAALLTEQIDHQVRWADSLDYILGRDPGAAFIELGETPTLGGTVRRARRRAGQPA
jgi:malonyl CoA-acyl carrier protein transacylase